MLSRIAKLVVFNAIVFVVILAAIESLSATAHYYWKIKPQSRFATMSLVKNLFVEPRDMQAAPPREYPHYLFNTQLHDPGTPYLLANPTMAEIVYCQLDERFGSPMVRFASDSLGFRNRLEFSESFDAVLVGDSFVEGACVNDGDTFADVMNANGVSTYALGRGGSGPLFQLALLREYGRHIASTEIVWVIFAGNDLKNLREEKGTLLGRYLTDPEFTQNLFAARDGNDKLLKDFLQRRSQDNVLRKRLGAPKPTMQGYGETLDSLDAHTYEKAVFRKVAEAFLHESRSQGSKLRLVLLENDPHFDREIAKHIEEEVQDFAEQESIPIMRIDLADAFRQGHLPQHFDTHYYRVVGDKLAKWVLKMAAAQAAKRDDDIRKG